MSYPALTGAVRGPSTASAHLLADMDEEHDGVAARVRRPTTT